MSQAPSHTSEETAALDAPAGGDAEQVHAPARAWSTTTHRLLLATGLLLALGTFWTVLSMPDMPYHPARDLELKATYDAYRDTGVLLVKENGTGSWYGNLPGTGLTKAAGDDDPGSYLIASLMGKLTGSTSPYPGLRWAMALLCALPMLLLPITMARLFGRARAGFAMLGLPFLTWFVNDSLLVGTEYGQADLIAPLPVYALYGLPASLVFLSLVVAAWALTHRLTWRSALAMSVVLVLLGTAGNLLRSMSGLGIAVLVGFLWWSALRGRGRGVAWGVGALTALVGVLAVQVGPGLVMDRINASRATVISAQTAKLPDAHGTWHPLYLGLSYPEPITGAPSPYDVRWSDEFGWQKAAEVQPGVVPASAEYDAIVKDFYLDAVKADPVKAVGYYLGKTGYTLRHFGAAITFMVLSGLLLWRRRPTGTGGAVRVAATTVPVIALGLVPPVLVMPMLYYYSELAAGLALLTALALAGLVCAMTGMPRAARSDTASPPRTS